MGKETSFADYDVGYADALIMVIDKIDDRVRVLQKARPPTLVEEYTPEVYELLSLKRLLECEEK